ncbi:MAG TPA: TIGR02147 family protein [Chitinivibrionales bacterium]|nr:TIGR02147 family protein [Chitinivibrionales bacterium]
MNSIFEYIDYRRYLKDFYNEAKKTKKYFSYRFFALRAGVHAPILLKMVIDGKRNLSRKTIEKFIKGLGIKEKEAVFFRNLVLFNQASSALEKQEHYRVLRSMAEQVPQHLMEDDHFEYFDRWYYSALREGVCQHDYKDDWAKVARCVHPEITADEAKRAVEWLVGHGLVRKFRNGRYEQTHKAITTRSEVKSMVVRNFNRTMLRLAERSLDNIPLHERHASGVTVGLTKEAYTMIEAEIEAFRDRVVKIVDSLDSSDRVYQINIQMFPLMFSPGSNDTIEEQS